ncbi:hypothetical protein EC973_000211 [Apophysomyces ossiformis]|uniref:HSF-type DNA-binding domain-containing protein n=1 Tax=Apophysomyces ossiformis TaxID=679940 RepID=A0A8H7BYU7_9FUNG|nr:hypothetical protein EC973_000211 [Apophysomyces ossiformis]
MSLQLPSAAQSAKSGHNNTFVHKLYNMVVDKQYQHLIAWNYTGTSFVVCNIMEFSRDVLPKHFKHSNFSSFVRQLNMYGFHKVNKSPRGHRTLAENQIWEFSHPKFMRGRPDLLEEIKRKAMETESGRRESDVNSHMAMLQMAQTDMMQQLAHLQENFSEVVRELAETRRRQGLQQQMMKDMMDFLTQHHGAQLQLPPENYDLKPDPERPPPIYVTSPDTEPQLQNYYHNHHQQRQHHHHSEQNTPLPTHSSPPLTIQTQNLSQSSRLTMSMSFNGLGAGPISPSFSVYQSAVNTPLPPSPSPSTFMSDDDMVSMYSPRSPNTPNSFVTGVEDSRYVTRQHQDFTPDNGGNAFAFAIGAQGS